MSAVKGQYTACHMLHTTVSGFLLAALRSREADMLLLVYVNNAIGVELVK